MKMEKDQKKLVFGATPFILLLSLPLLCVGVDFVWGNRISLDQWMQYFSSSESGGKTVEDKEFINFHLARLVRGEDRRKLDDTGFACDKAIHSIHCVSTKPVRIDTRNMTVYIPSDADWQQETAIRPYARQEDELKQISAVRMIQYSNTTDPPPCEFSHHVPAVVFSSGSTGNVFHEMNEIIIPLYITTKQFQSRVVFVIEDYKPSFIAKYGAVLAHLSAHEAMNPAANATVHCFPASIVGLKYHDNLALNSSDIPGGYGMPEFRHFLRGALGLRFAHVSQIARPRLLLLSRTNTRRFLNEDEMIGVIKDVGFQVMVVRRSKLASNVNKFSQLINSCSVLLGAHGAGLTNEIFLPTGAVMIQVELLGTGWASNTYYGDTARAMGVRYLRYKIEGDESSLAKLYGRNSSVVTDPGSVYREGGYIAARTMFLDQQNVRLNLARFRETIVEALSVVTDWPAR
ncbi:alpha-1,3-arabinosyltransferase XAT3-like [Salvia miltiorrhiza]|uniref:alpha-1,3-arabinosyltransferase XAT3-like n=1 Tax=Salvia miltiorrhiza TaxID=226208 RepID=UPI0025AD30D4|nr:alpha-1,3-arabinosyltransferase XAT3-like [Salvia miltiorrhiza]